MIYLVKAEETNLYKIGYTKGQVKNRVKGLQTSCPHKLSIVKEVDGSLSKERQLHEIFAENRQQGEWFKFNEKTLEKVFDTMEESYIHYQQENIEDMKGWRDRYEGYIRKGDCTMSDFIDLAIYEIMLGRNDMAIQRLLEFNELVFTRAKIRDMPPLTERIWRKKK
tara:strand:+ start:1183 stop:1680 length:498 start_codon:yes stop_codon:yes gene_type:complete